MTYLRRHPKTRVFYFRRGIPAELRPFFADRHDYNESLGTKDEDEAKLKLPAVARRVEILFRQARAQLRSQRRNEPASVPFSPADVTCIVSEWKQAERIRRATQVINDPRATAPLFEREAELFGVSARAPDDPSEWRRRLCAEVWAVQAKADELMNARGFVLPVAAPVRTVLHQLIRKSWLEVLHEEEGWRGLGNNPGPDFSSFETLLRAVENNIGLPATSGAILPVVVESCSGPPSSAPAHATSGKTLEEARKAWVTERGYKRNYLVEQATAFKRLTSFLSGDVAVASITGPQIVEFKTLLFDYPRHVTRAEAVLPFRELIALKKAEEVAGKPYQRIKLDTVSKTLGILLTAWGFFKKNHMVASNIVEGVVPERDARNPPSDRVEVTDLTDTEALIIYQSPLYRGARNKLRMHLPGHVQVNDHRYWLPLLGDHTGARLEELAQLYVADVKQQLGEIWYLNLDTIIEGEEAKAGVHKKSLKTRASKRMVPIHPNLIRLGLLDYVEHIRAQGHARLFPKLTPDSKGRLSGNYSKMFNGYLEKLELKPGKPIKTERSKCYHSYRHRFKTLAREAEVPKPIYDAIQGHGSLDQSDRYGARQTLKILKTRLHYMMTMDFKLPDDLRKWQP